MELADLRKTICSRKTLVSVERISVHKITENLMEHAMLHQIFSDYTVNKAAKGEGWAPSFIRCAQDTVGLGNLYLTYCLPCSYTKDVIYLLL